MNKSGNTLLRQLAMLQCLQRYPRKVSTTEIRDRLAERGYPTTIRTVQRDLMKLAELLPIDLDDERYKPRGWSWHGDAAILDIPGLDPQAALTFKLVESHLKPMLPAATLAFLQPYFKASDGVLRLLQSRYGKWPDKVRVLPRGQPLLAPKIDEGVQSTVYQALLDEKRLNVEYLSRGERKAKQYEVNPLALVVRDRVVYLVCTMWGYEDARQLVLHRFKSAELIDKPCTLPKGFDIDAYIARGEFGFPSGKKIKLSAVFDREAATHLYETPLSADQSIAEKSNGKLKLTATVADTRELMWWLLGFGANVEVVGPSTLRRAIREHATAMTKRHFQPIHSR